MLKFYYEMLLFDNNENFLSLSLGFSSYSSTDGRFLTGY